MINNDTRCVYSSYYVFYAVNNEKNNKYDRYSNLLIREMHSVLVNKIKYI